jgi:formylglycine-generating enzyme required for sulfatase activity
MVGWDDAVLFCNWLSIQEQRKPCYQRVTRKEKEGDITTWHCDFEADGYRLPTEAEWEYACRAGTTTLWSFGKDKQWAASYAVFDTPTPEPVASRLPNDWGLFDMHGNGREWCWDYYGKNYPKAQEIDPTGPATGKARVQRGGGWFDHPRDGLSGFRNVSNPDKGDRLLGFRVACTIHRPVTALNFPQR